MIKKGMLILGIETSCDETAVSLLEIENNKIKVLSNTISSQVKLHAKYGGVVPSLAAREHVKNLAPVLKMALRQPSTINRQLSIKDIDLIAVTRGPGLISSLLVGTTFAKTLAWKYKKPIIGVNHLEGHIASNWLPPSAGNLKSQISNLIKNKGSQKILNTKYEILDTNMLPALCLIVSGGHTELVLMTAIGKYKLIGQTLDDAAGEAFDKIARILGLGYPGGPAISAAAEIAVSSSSYLVSSIKNPKIQNTKYKILNTRLPRPMIKSKDFNFSFAGLKTAVLYLVRDLTKTMSLSKIKTAIAAEAQQAIVDVLVTKTIRAAEKYKVKSIMLSGGVSANKLLRSELENETHKKGIIFFKPEMEYTTDNAAMIALAGYFNYKTGKKKTPGTSLERSAGQADWKSTRVNANLGF